MSTVASAFERATAVEPLGVGAWRASCDDAWTTYLGVSGGLAQSRQLALLLGDRP